MKLTFVSNYINHHQKPLSDELYKKLGDDYTFIQTEPMEEERIKMGWDTDFDNLPYLKKYYENGYDCKKIIQYSGAKKSNNQNMTKNTKSRSKKEYGNLNINDLNAQMSNKNNLSENKNETNKLKKHNLDNILSESDSCQEIDSMEEESLSHGIKSSNVNLKAIPNMKRDFLDVKSKNDLDYKRHLTSGINSLPIIIKIVN